MGTFSIWHWLIVIVYLAVILIPMAVILGKAGYNKAWSVLFLIPILNLIALWVFAFSKWPGTGRRFE